MTLTSPRRRQQPRARALGPALAALAALTALTALAGGCASTPRPAPPLAAPAPAPAPPPTLPGPGARLERAVRPTHYALSLTVDPRADRFTGEEVITLAVDAPTTTVILHAEGLEITAAEARDAAGGTALTVFAGDGVIALRADRPLAAGPVALTLRFSGPLGEAPVGLYRVAHHGRAYAFTQFEPLDARRAFPCFDQPDLKAPLTLRLRVPRGMLALANAPEVARRDDDAAWTTFEFAATPPLPTYLVAFAVGELVAREAAPGASPVPIRVVTTPEQAALTDFALHHVPIVLAALIDWFGTPHPFAKLDLVAVPNFAAGAMENPGLVTFREELLLMDGDDAPLERRLYARSILAHELAHLWFGDLVTPAWWDDLWLNEAFATWMASKTTDRLAPELDVAVRGATWRGYAMDLDARASARAIRQPIRDTGDIHNAFDGITYTKGANLLAMIEAWIGPDVMRQGVRSYLAAHAYANGTTADLLGALDAASDKDVSAVVQPWLDQPGTPLVDLMLQCNTRSPATLRLRQQRFVPEGEAAPLGTPWPIPMCIRYAIGAQVTRECFVFAEPEASRTLAVPGCPRWLAPNDGEWGYYRWRFLAAPPRAPRGGRTVGLEALLRHEAEALGPRERVALLLNLRALVEAGALPVERFAEALAPLARSSDPQVLATVRGALGFLWRLTPARLEGRWRALAGALFASHRGLIATPRLAPGPDTRERERARRVLSTYAGVVEDPALLAVALEVTDTFLQALAAGGPGPSAEEIDLYLAVAARATPAPARPALWRRLRTALDEARSPFERTAVIAALGRFEEPALVTRSLDLLLDGTLMAQDFRTLTGALGSRPETALAAWTWLEAHFDALVAKLGAQAAPGLPWLAARLCDAADATRVQAFFEARRDHIASGLERNLAGTVETIATCARQRERHGPAWVRWLEALQPVRRQLGQR